MTTTPGAGVTERREDWTFESLLEDFAADKKLSRAKKAWLDQQYDRIELSGVQPNIAGGFWCDELDLPEAVYVVQLVARLLDYVKPRKEGPDRLFEISKELHALGHLTDEEFETLDR